MPSPNKNQNNLRPSRLLSTGLLSAFMFLLAPNGATAQVGQTVQTDLSQEVFLVNVIANKALIGESLEVYRFGPDLIYIDFDLFVEIIEFDIARDGEIRFGTTHSEDRSFRLDTKSNRVSYAGKARSLDTGSVKAIDGTILVERGSLAQWFEIEIKFDAHEQQLTVISQSPLPFQLENLRKQRQKVLQNTAQNVSPEDTLEVPNQYHIFTSPQLDLSAAFFHDQDGDQATETGTLAISAGFDLIGNAFYYSGNSTSDFGDTSDIQQRLTIERHSRLANEDIFLGFNSYTLGDLYSS